MNHKGITLIEVNHCDGDHRYCSDLSSSKHWFLDAKFID